MMENKTKIDLKNKSIFITGVAGFIGSNLAKRLLSTVKGVKVVGLDNMNHYYDVRLKEARLNELEQFESFSFVKGNLVDKAVIESIFEQYKPEIVVNLGAQAGVRYAASEKCRCAHSVRQQYAAGALRGRRQDLPDDSCRHGKPQAGLVAEKSLCGSEPPHGAVGCRFSAALSQCQCAGGNEKGL
jgi:NAD(P)-dependent dehydrogenase (short-subunit alcohol dehydrogenase family)